MRIFVIAVLLLFTTLLSAQSSPATSPQNLRTGVASHPEWPRAKPADVDTIGDIVRAFYSAISAPSGGKLDQNRLRSLFVPGGRIVSNVPRDSAGVVDLRFLSPDGYAAISDAHTATAGFFDRNPANQIERFGVMAHVHSMFESRSHVDDPEPMARGIKSFELLNNRNRWYIVEVYWGLESPDNLIPKQYLHDSVR
ncbi:MAG: hypothetical protein WCC26_13990 [Terracidiphilus sp.]